MRSMAEVDLTKRVITGLKTLAKARIVSGALARTRNMAGL